MLVNLSESLGYKTPSNASTGLFVASFLGLGQLGFLFLTGSTTSLIAWGLLPDDVRAQFTWATGLSRLCPYPCGDHHHFALHDLSLSARVTTKDLLYDGANPTQYSWAAFVQGMDQLGVLLFTVTGWPRLPTTHRRRLDRHHRLCDLVNTGIIDWNMLRKGIDWELLIHMGVTLAISNAFETVKNRSMARRRHVAFDFTLHG